MACSRLALSVLQILCIDIGTDLLPALALGGEAPSKGVLERPPERRHLVDTSLFTRVFGVLGPTEALVEMTAFLVALMVAGWRPGGEFPHRPCITGRIGGAAFTAVVLGQIGTAFACRSTSRPPWAMGWTTNRLLLWAVLAELGALVFFLLVTPVADLLGHTVPPTEGFVVAVLAIPAVLLADYTHKRVRQRRKAVGARPVA